MIIKDNNGHEINISVRKGAYSGKKGFEKFKKDFKKLNIDFEDAYIELTGSKPPKKEKE